MHDRVLLVLIAGLTSAFGSDATAQSHRALDQIERAKTLIGTDEKEAAATALRRAWRHSEHPRTDSASVKRKLQKDIGQLLRSLDPRSKTVAQDQVKFAKELYDSVEKYRKKGWDATALELLRACAALYPEMYANAARELEAAVDAARPVDDPATGNRVLRRWFEGGVQPTKEKTWELTDDGLFSPAGLGKKDEDSSILLSGPPLDGDARIRLQVRVPPNGRFAFLWDARYEGATMDFHMVEVQHVKGGTHLDAHFVDDQEVERLANAWLKLDESGQAEWLPLEIEIRGQEVRARLGTMPEPVAFALKRPPTGHLGVYVHGSTKSPEPVQIRHLSVERYRQIE